MNSNIEYYRTHGLQAVGTVTFSKVPVTDARVTIDSYAYVYNPAFDDLANFTGHTAEMCAKSLCDCINAKVGTYLHTHNNVNAVKPYYAMYYGPTVLVIASQPGIGGNSLAMVISGDTGGAMAVSGATLSGGVDGAATTSTSTSLSPTASITPLSIETGTFTATGSAAVMSAVEKKYAKLHILPAAGNAADGTIGDSVAQPFTLVKGVWYAFDPPPLAVGDMNDLYINGTGADTYAWLRWY